MVRKIPEDDLNVPDQPEPNLFSAEELVSNIVQQIFPVFKKFNIFLIIALFVIYFFDNLFLFFKLIAPSDRIIDKYVVMALISAIAAQMAVIILSAIRRIK